MNLLTHAISKVWQAPRQDKQVVLRLKLVSKDSLMSFVLQRELFKLPNATERFVVYQAGAVNTEVLNLSEVSNRWIRADLLCPKSGMQLFAYDLRGEIVSLHNLYLRIAKTGNLMIAISDLKFAQGIFLKFYTNEYMNQTGTIKCFGSNISKVEDVISLQNQLGNFNLDKTYILRNGLLVNSIGGSTLTRGETVSFVEDPTIKDKVDFPLKDLSTFISAVDNNSKLLLHPKYKDLTINYQDDLELWLVDLKDDLQRGKYIYRNAVSTLRQITHTDWGLDYQMIRTLMDEDRDVNDFAIRVIVRKSNDGDLLTHEFNRIKELYKYTHSEIEKIMLSQVSTLEIWTAGELEASDYARLLRSPLREIDPELVYKAYGYSASSYYVTYNHYYLDSGGEVELCEQLKTNSTVYEYSDVGNFLGSQYHPHGKFYVRQNDLCTQIQVYSGRPGKFLSYNTSEQDFVLKKELGYRFYKTPKPWVPGQSTLVEITGDSGEYEIVDGKVNWLFDKDGLLGICVNDSYFYQDDFRVAHDDLMDIEINSDFEYESLEVWINNKPLVEGIDFVYKNHRLYIFSNLWIKLSNLVTVRGFGIKTDSPKYDVKLTTGFIYDGRLMVDESYELVENKILKCIAGNAVFDIQKLNWENSTMASVDNSLNGKPYSVREIMAPVRGIKDYDPYYMREKSKELDAKVINFSNVHKDIPDYVTSIDKKHPLYSSVMFKVIWDLTYSGRQILKTHQDDDDLDLWMSQYQHLMEVDVARSDIDIRFVEIVPSPDSFLCEVTSEEYTFLERINKTYLNDLVTLSGYVKLKQD